MTDILLLSYYTTEENKQLVDKHTLLCFPLSFVYKTADMSTDYLYYITQMFTIQN
jgi:hypothetical protein